MNTIADYFAPILNVISGVVSVGTSAAGGDVAGTAVGYGGAILSGQAAISNSDYLATLSTVVGTGSAANTLINQLPTQLGNMSSALANYDEAVASGNQGAISSAGLAATSSVASVLNTIGGMVAGIADALGGAGLISATAAAPVVSLGLAISAAAGLLTTAASSAVVDAVRNAANAIADLLNDVESQSGTGSGALPLRRAGLAGPELPILTRMQLRRSPVPVGTQWTNIQTTAGLSPARLFST